MRARSSGTSVTNLWTVALSFPKGTQWLMVKSPCHLRAATGPCLASGPRKGVVWNTGWVINAGAEEILLNLGWPLVILEGSVVVNGETKSQAHCVIIASPLLIVN